MHRRRTTIWLTALGLCIAAGIGMELAYPRPPLPQHIGYYLAGGAVLAGFCFGLRGVALPVIAIVVFGLARLIDTGSASPGDNQTGVIVGFFFLILPVIYGGLAAVGAAIRVVLRLLRRSNAA